MATFKTVEKRLQQTKAFTFLPFLVTSLTIRWWVQHKRFILYIVFGCYTYSHFFQPVDSMTGPATAHIENLADWSSMFERCGGRYKLLDLVHTPLSFTKILLSPGMAMLINASIIHFEIQIDHFAVFTWQESNQVQSYHHQHEACLTSIATRPCIRSLTLVLMFVTIVSARNNQNRQQKLEIRLKELLAGSILLHYSARGSLRNIT